MVVTEFLSSRAHARCRGPERVTDHGVFWLPVNVPYLRREITKVHHDISLVDDENVRVQVRGKRTFDMKHPVGVEVTYVGTTLNS